MARRAPRLLHAALTATAVLALGAPGADAAFPGQNGALAIGRAYEDRPEETSRFEIQSVAPDGSGRRTLLSCSSAAGDCPGAGAPAFPGLYDPVRSPDGQRLAIGLGNGIGVAAADGSGLRELAGLPASAREPAWSPDGRELVFSADGPPTPDGSDRDESDLYIVPIDGGLVRPLTATRGISERQPTWGLRPAADAGRIAYARQGDIWSLRPDGQGVRRLTGRGGADPSFSPYASTIAFVRRNQIYTVLSRGGDLDRVTNLGGRSPTWSPDGRRIAFIRGDGAGGGRDGLYRMGPKGRALTRFARVIFDSSCECTFERSLDWGPRR